MGNRAIITTKEKKTAIYLHWNGGRDSVEGFLTYCRLMGFRSPETDEYGFARLVQVVANFFGADGLSVGVGPFTGSAGDNGIYIVGDNWKIVGREDYSGEEQDEYPLDEMLDAINECQPLKMQLPSAILHGTPWNHADPLEPGQKIFRRDFDGKWKEETVQGICDDNPYHKGEFHTDRYPRVSDGNGGTVVNANSCIRPDDVIFVVK
jgi:hypothetical protein